MAVIKHESLVNEIYLSGMFVSIADKFGVGAIREYGSIEVVGQLKIVPLQICIDWEERCLYLGYACDLRHPPRVELGFEIWYLAPTIIGNQNEFNSFSFDTKKSEIDAKHFFLLKVFLNVQYILKNNEIITEVEKSQIDRLMTFGCD